MVSPRVSARRPIAVLPDSVASRIAAGEVIVRARSVVRELLDNAIDAGARTIDVEITGGGYDRIAVHDDGTGIPESDVTLLFARHATSKMPETGLDHVRSLGFRGEALASIAAVGTAEIRTRFGDETSGSLIQAVRGNISRAPIGRRPGTSVVVTDLFRSFPVRRASADPAVETVAIRRLVSHMALLHPTICFTLAVDDRDVLRKPAGTLDEATELIFGRRIAAGLLRFPEFEYGGYLVSGVVSSPSTHRARRDEMVTGVNGRLCEVTEITRALDRAYGDVLPRRRHPWVVLHLSAPPEAVDANVHPAKERVEMRDAVPLANAIEQQLRALIGRSMHLPGGMQRLALRAGDLAKLGASESSIGYGSGGWGDHVVTAGSLPRLRLVGQIDQTLIVCESELGTLLVDQHRAHERVIFERLLVAGSVELDAPARLDFPAHLSSQLLDVRDDLVAMGWRIAPGKRGSWHVSAVPRVLDAGDLAGIIELAALEDSVSVMASAACHTALRKRRPLTADTAVELLTALTATANPSTCPHGQPIVLRLDQRFLERQFSWR